MKKRVFLLLFLLSLAILFIPLLKKELPVMRAKESFRSVFPNEEFQTKINRPVPEWMRRQLESDFREFKAITSDTVEKTYRQIEKTTPIEDCCYRYRILDNQLYKYVSSKMLFSRRDNPLERALKTLLLFCRVPDVDFILCTMDGVPEPYMPSDFFLTDDPKEQAPILANAKLENSMTRYIVLIPDKFSLSDEWVHTAKEIQALNQEIPWHEKKEIAFWRGGLTDIGIPNGTFFSNYHLCPRFKICKLSLEFPERIDAGITWVDCEKMNEALLQDQVIKGAASKRDHLLCKYLPVLDGHMCTYPGYQWRLLSNSVCFKQESDQIQWFYSAIKSYVHYIPLKNDMSDLIDRILWAKSHEEEVKEISKNGREFARNHLMPADDYLYLYLVLQKYASLQEIDFKKIGEETKKGECWRCIQYRKRLVLSKSWNRMKKRFLAALTRSRCQQSTRLQVPFVPDYTHS